MKFIYDVRWKGRVSVFEGRSFYYSVFVSLT